MKKNVILFLCDQLRSDCLGCYGNPYVKTPHIDSLAEAGVRYERCYTVNPLCMPSRNSIVTGMYPRNHGLWANGVLAQDEGNSLAWYLSRQGYQTANVGKMHFQPTGDPEGTQSEEAKVHWSRNPAHQIRENYWGYEYIRATVGHSIVTGNYREWFLEKGGNDAMFSVAYTGEHTGGMQMPKELHCSSYVGEMAVEYLKEKRNREQPFFLTVSFPDPHFPFTPPGELVKERAVQMPVGGPEDLEGRHISYRQHFMGSWDRDGVGEARTPEGVSASLTAERIARTYEMIELADENVGRVLKAVKEEGLWDDTVIVFLSDHGELLGDHGLWFKGPFLYEGVIRVPLLIRDGGGRTGAGVSRELVSVIDLFPTICDLAGVEIPFYVDGISLLDPERKRETCLVEYRNGYGKADFTVYAAVTQRYKWIRYDDGFQELTDLEKDPGERWQEAENPAYAQTVREMADAMLSEILQTSCSRFPQICGN